MEWADEGIVLHVRRHGENAAILELLTRDHGRHLGLVQGGGSKRLRGILQPGNTLRAVWRARLAEHLGVYTVEPVVQRVSTVLADRKALAGLTAAASVAAAALPEREPHPRVFEGLSVLLDALDDPDTWPAVLVRWEMGLLDDLGFGLDLSACAVTGETESLAFVSPRSGRAVTREGAGNYTARLLPLPDFLAGRNGRTPSPEDVRDGLRLTGFFLEKRIFAPSGNGLPSPRAALDDVIGGAVV